MFGILTMLFVLALAIGLAIWLQWLALRGGSRIQVTGNGPICRPPPLPWPEPSAPPPARKVGRKVGVRLVLPLPNLPYIVKMVEHQRVEEDYSI
jgi:hypothetical protein